MGHHGFGNLFGRGGHHDDEHYYDDEHHDRYRPAPPTQQRPAQVQAQAKLCTKCDSPNEIDARFCKECGQSLVAVKCSACGAKLPGGSAFCNNCGLKV